MTTDNITTLRDTAIETLERFAFLLGDPETHGEAPPPLPAMVWIVTLTFTGPRTGTLAIATTPNLAQQIAANLYSIEFNDVTDEQAVDALKELLNVTAGDYLHELEGNEPIFDLSAPALIVAERGDFEQHWGDRTHTMLNVEGQPLWLGFGNSNG